MYTVSSTGHRRPLSCRRGPRPSLGQKLQNNPRLENSIMQCSNAGSWAKHYYNIDSLIKQKLRSQLNVNRSAPHCTRSAEWPISYWGMLQALHCIIEIAAYTHIYMHMRAHEYHSGHQETEIGSLWRSIQWPGNYTWHILDIFSVRKHQAHFLPCKCLHRQDQLRVFRMIVPRKVCTCFSGNYSTAVNTNQATSVLSEAMQKLLPERWLLHTMCTNKWNVTVMGNKPLGSCDRAL